MLSTMPDIAAFDFDGTLTDGGSVFTFLSAVAGRRAVALREIREALRLNPTLINAQKLLDRAQAQRGPKADLAPSP